jgi:hypothetical protein
MCDPKAHTTIGQEELVTPPNTRKRGCRAIAGRKFSRRMLRVKKE